MALLFLFLPQIASATASCHSCIPHPTNIYSMICAIEDLPLFGTQVNRYSIGPWARTVPGHLTSIPIRFLSMRRVWYLPNSVLCFYFTFEFIDYSYECDGKRLEAKLRIGHPIFSKQRRFKRWLRRRNPDPNTIHFQQESYVKELAESAAPGTLVVTVKAVHVADQPLYYSLAAPQDSRSQNIFTLDTLSGEIRLAKSLDREILDKHVLKVTAYERLDPTVSSSVTVTVDVLDVQDNSPIFERDSYFADIREDAP
ncbi:cadherin domain protein, partial [Cooperia oncophora]